MSRYLIDTDVISMLSPAKVVASPAVLDWLEQKDGEDALFLSVVTIHELRKGIVLLEHRGATAKAAHLMTWADGLLAAYDDRILKVDAATAAIAARLEAKALCAGHDPGMADALIAGTAVMHDLVILTRNARHFLPFGVPVSTPAEAAKRP